MVNNRGSLAMIRPTWGFLKMEVRTPQMDGLFFLQTVNMKDEFGVLRNTQLSNNHSHHYQPP